MKRILIIEDEQIAAQHLRRTLLEVMPDAEVLPTLQSIEESVEYFARQPMPDIIFADIQLADGLSFRIFDQVEITCPLVFTTAYDQYALQAFRSGGVDYLLKPIDRDDLQHTLDKLDKLGIATSKASIATAAETFHHYRSHFLIPLRDRLIPIELKQIACFYLEDKVPRAIFFDGHEQTIDRPLDTVMENIDPEIFFRANRQYIVAHSAIKEIVVWPISKLALTLVVPTPDRIIVSKAKVAEFKQWYTK